MSLDAEALSDSVFLADLAPAERSLPRFFATVALGLAAFIVATVVALLISVGVYILAFGWPSPATPEGLRALTQRFADLAALDGRRFTSAMEIIGVALPSNVLPMFAFVGVAAAIYRRSIRRIATAAPRFRWRLMLLGLALSVILIGPFLAAAQMMDPKALPPPLLTVSKDPLRLAIYGLTCIVGFVPAAMGEELLFRGWLLRESGAVTRNVAVLLAFNGVVFAAAHLDFSPDAFLERAIMGAGLAYATLRLGGIELSCGIHAANNLMIVLFLQPLTLKLTPNTGLDVGSLVSYVALFLAYAFMAELAARWPPLRAWSGAQITQPPPQAPAGPWG